MPESDDEILKEAERLLHVLPEVGDVWVFNIPGYRDKPIVITKVSENYVCFSGNGRREADDYPLRQFLRMYRFVKSEDE